MDLHTQNKRIARVIQTKRLRLRPLAQDDVAWVTRIAGDYEVSKMLVPVPHPYTMSDAQEFMRMDHAGELGTLWVITRDGSPIGVISIGKELGYWTDSDAWGNGYMTEAARATIDAHFDGSDDALIESSHFVENDASRRVLEKVGFVDVGPHEHFSSARQAHVPGRGMELTRDRWLQLNA